MGQALIWRGELRRPARCRSGGAGADGKRIGEGWNRPIGGCDPTAHAEALALLAAERTGITGCGLYAVRDAEPCPMRWRFRACAGGAGGVRGRLIHGGARQVRYSSVAIALAQPSVRGDRRAAEECGL